MLLILGLIAVMTELCELLDTLAIVKPGASLGRPLSDTGIHLASDFITMPRLQQISLWKQSMSCLRYYVYMIATQTWVNELLKFVAVNFRFPT